VIAGEPTQNIHIAFSGDDDDVRRFHADATAAGYRSNGEPGRRARYDEGYYAAFVLDSDANNIEVVNTTAGPRDLAEGAARHATAHTTIHQFNSGSPSPARAHDRLLPAGFAQAGSVTALLGARVLQGLSAGAAVGALGAGMLDLDKANGTLANAASPPIGTATGALGAGLLVAYLPDPTHLVYLMLLTALTGSDSPALGGLALFILTASARLPCHCCEARRRAP
jgi:hypothetical protein